MQVIVTKHLVKDVDKELDKSLQLQLADVIEQMRDVGTLQEIPKIKKLAGYKAATGLS